MLNVALESGWQLSPEAILFYQKHPVKFVVDQLRMNPHAEQAEGINAVIRDGERVSWKSGHGAGKSVFFALLGLAFIYLFGPAKVVVTAPKREQLYDTIWPEASRIINKSLLVNDYEWQKTKIFLRGKEDTAVMLARTASSPEALAGQHDENMLYLVDEASGVAEEIFATVEGALTSSQSRMALAGNPTQTNGYFFDSHHRDRALWHRITSSVENHPNADQAYAKRIAQKWGRDTDVYRVRVLGEFPRGDPHTFIKIDQVEAAVNRDVEAAGPIELGCDIARFGDDRTISLGRMGHHVFKDHVDMAQSAVDEAAAAILDHLSRLRKATGNTADARIKVDDTGVGGGVTDLLRRGEENGGYVVVPCNFGGAGNDEYDDEATIMWAALRDVIGDVQLPNIEDMVGEVSNRRFFMTPKGRIKLESKKDYKARIGSSPDYADALVLCFAEGDLIGNASVISATLSTTDWG